MNVGHLYVATAEAALACSALRYGWEFGRLEPHWVRSPSFLSPFGWTLHCRRLKIQASYSVLVCAHYPTYCADSTTLLS